MGQRSTAIIRVLGRVAGLMVVFVGTFSASVREANTEEINVGLEQAASDHIVLYQENFDDNIALGWNPDDENEEGEWGTGNGQFFGKGPATARYEWATFGVGTFSFQFYPTQLNYNFYINLHESEVGAYHFAFESNGDGSIHIFLQQQYGCCDYSEILADNWISYDFETEYEAFISISEVEIRVYVGPVEPPSIFVTPVFITPVPIIESFSEPFLVYQISDPLPDGGISLRVNPEHSVAVDDFLYTGPRYSAIYRMQGRVFEGELNDTSRPLPGIEVAVYGTNSPEPDPGAELDWLSSSISGSDGRYYLDTVPIGYPFYVIRQEETPGYRLVGARTEPDGGRVRDDLTIVYYTELWEQVLFGNQFFLLPFETETPTPSPSSTPTGSATPTITPTEEETLEPGLTPTLTRTSVPPPPPTPPPEEDNRGLLLGLLGGGALLVLGGVGGTVLLVRLLRRPPSPPRQPPEKPPEKPGQPPPLPIIPPIRLVKVWLTEGAERGGSRVSDNQALVGGASYNLNVQVQPGLAQELGAMQPGEAGQLGETSPLKLVLFSPEEDFALDRSPATLNLPGKGASTLIRRVVTPGGPGLRRVRVCVYYGNVLLQSALVEADVAGSAGQALGAIRRSVDYVANPSLASLEAMPQPSVSIFTNQVSDGTHWIGVYADGDAAGIRLRSGMLHRFSEDELKERARTLRELLAEIQGVRPYRFISPLPLDETKLQRLESDLVRLALKGWQAFHSLFLAEADVADYDRLPGHTQPGLISIARCRGQSPTLPWAALYDLALDTGQEGTVHLCPEFKAQLTANKWSADGAVLLEKHDLLDNLRACRNLAACPLKGDRRKQTVCPFGFWGFLHQIEQPLQNVTPTPVDQVPPELGRGQQAERFSQEFLLLHPGAEKVRIAMGAYAGIPDANDHFRELRGLEPETELEIEYSQERSQVLQRLEEGNRHLFYFYCHGVLRDQVFRLMLGQDGGVAYLSATDLDPRETRWSGGLHPLVVLNGCETMRLTPELVHGFLGTLRQMGASGVVGSEIPVNTLLARPVGRQLVKHLLDGLSIGEAFLVIRRDLQRQGNPLGLAYSYYSPATLHLHDPEECRWCRARLPAPSAPAGAVSHQGSRDRE